MQVLPRWKSLLIMRNLVDFSSTQLASFHSTPVCCQKWKKNWNSDFRRSQQPSKNYARYVIRQKRADAKRALKSLLFNCEDVGTFFQKGEQSWKADGTSSWDTDFGGKPNSSTKKGRSKSDPEHAQKIHNHKMRRKYRKGKGFFSEDDDDDPETVFHANFGKRWYTWSFKSSWTESSHSSTNGFDWREHFHRTNSGRAEWEAAGEADSDDEMCDVGSYSDRAVLGLPRNGPLKLKDVKNAFHISALKWHPDKHQGPSQAAAEEKFKLCVNAYKSLCSALSAA